MKIRLKFQFTCKHCGKTSNSFKEIKECEKLCNAKEELRRRTPIIPEGMMYGEPQNPEAFYPNITFCVAKKRRQDATHVEAGLWACRQNCHGDTLGNEYCGGNGAFPGYDRNIPNVYHVTFIRMYNYLKQTIGVENITVWNGKKPIHIIDYLIANGTTLIEYDTMLEREREELWLK